MKRNKEYNVYRLLLEDDKVNIYAKIILLISQCNHFDRYYIPNKLIENKLKISKRQIHYVINELKNRGIIKVYYNGTKRYLKLCSYDYIANYEPFNDDWLSDDF